MLELNTISDYLTINFLFILRKSVNLISDWNINSANECSDMGRVMLLNR